MPAKRAERDAVFGLNNADTDGTWLYLTLYKPNVKLKLGPKHPLANTVPNIGFVQPGNYLPILHRFIDHWAMVDAALTAQTPPKSPLVLGTLNLAELRSRAAQITALIGAIDETTLTRLSVMRAEREQIMGDVREEDRENDSFIARAIAYHTEVSTQFAGTPLAATLPRIFPDESAGEKKFDFNFKQSGATVTVWFTMPDGVSDAAVVYLKEGAFEETVAIPSCVAMKVTFSGVSVQGEVDEVELRDAAGKTVAFGRFKSDLVEPV